MSLFPNLHTLGTYYELGGFVMLPLILVAVVLWYALVFRLINVQTSSHGPRQLIEKARNKTINLRSVTAKAAVVATETADAVQPRSQLRSQLNEKFNEFTADINQHRALVRTLVAVAPLLGLLGTVDGMIETFDSLGDMALFTETGGIAAGVSRALFTTQMGLAISIPGLLIGRMLERKQHNIVRELDQIKDLVCAEKDNS